MARVTIEDCTKIIPSRFELVILAAQRAKDISSGSPILVERDNDKNAVIALREISTGKINPDNLREEIITKHQKYSNMQSSNNATDNNEALSEDIKQEMASLQVNDAEQSLYSDDIEE